MYVIDYYKTDNFDNSELQARLYAEIYYDSNIENESRTADAPKTIPFDRTITDINVESMRPQCELEEQLLVSKIARGKSNKKSKISIEYYD